MSQTEIQTNVSSKQFDFLSSLKEIKRINILEGSVRSGKTWISLLGFFLLVANSPENSEFIMVGKTITSLKRNCLNLLQTIVGNGNFKFSISSKEGSICGRKVYLEGVNDSRAENKIRGMTLYGAYCDELTLFTEDFFTMLLSRLSMENSFLIGTTNPDTPSHWLLKNYISRRGELDIKVWKFTLEDNHTLPKSYIENLKKEYTGVFYDRFILGKWVAAEGLIYSKFANEKEKYIVDKIRPYDLQTVHIGIDYGASKSKTAFVAIGFTKGFKDLYVLKEKTTLGIKSPEEMYESFWKFYEELENEYGHVSFCYADWGGLGQVQTKGTQNYFLKRGKPIKIQDCFKVRIIERINMVCRLIGANRFKVHKDCKETIEALSSAVWEENKDDVRLDNGTVNIDVLDAMEYAFSNYMQSLNNSFNVPRKLDNMPIL